MTADTAPEPSNAVGLPTYFTRFIGRDRELSALRARLLKAAETTSPQARLTTLVGLGGSGKTRLAVELGTRLMIEPGGAQQFPDGAWWVDLAPVTDPDRVPQALAAAAGLSGLTLQGQQAALTKRLQRRRALVVIDNCEHLAAACEELCDAILPACPGIVILATSRIGLRGGHEFALTSMESHAAQPSTRSAQPSTRTDAVSLFYDRAGLVLSGYAAIARDEATVATICQLLNGLPLAIELAAPWIRTLSATDLLAHLDRSLEVLAASDETVSNRQGSTQADRHRSMRLVLDGTWTWLSEDERQVLRSLGIFVGGFSLEGAETVAGATLGILSALTERSLIRRVPGSDDSTRFVMHELVRQYAVDRLTELTSAELNSLRQRHLDHVVALTDGFMAARNGPEEARWWARLREEEANVEAAVAWGTAQGETERVLRAVGGMVDVWIYNGSVSRHRKQIESALELDWDTESTAAVDWRARVAYAAGWMNFELSAEGRGRPYFLEAFELLSRLGNTSEQAACLRPLSAIASYEGDHQAAARLARQSLAICRRTGDNVGSAWSLEQLAYAAYAADRLAEAERLLGDAITTFRRAGVRYGEQEALWELGTLKRRLRQWPDALHAYADSLALMRATGFTAQGRDILRGLAAVAAELGQFLRAARLFGAADTWEQTHGGYPSLVAEPPDRQRTATRVGLGEDAWGEAFAAGAGLSSEEALAEASACVTALVDGLAAPLPAGLTAREVEVLALLAEGLSNDDVAERLVVSPRTVHAHLRSVFGKLGVSSRTAAVREAARLGVRL